MSELLITDIPCGDHRMETVDLMNRGGFGAFLLVHEATTTTECFCSAPSHKKAVQHNSGSLSFFEWLERNQEQVAAVFRGIHFQASRMAITTNVGAATPEGRAKSHATKAYTPRFF